MAQLHPDLLPRIHTLGEAAEVDVVRRLGEGLPDGFHVFHSVEWSRGAGSDERHGEVDVVVVNPAGDLMLVEVKAGHVEFRGDGLFKRYGRENKDVTRQIKGQYGGMRARLDDARLGVTLQSLLVLPDLQVASVTAAWPRERIVDGDELDTLPRRVLQSLGTGIERPALLAQVLAFLANRFEVVRDVSALAGRLMDHSIRMSAGLATWVPRITAPSGVVRVVGTAGSGKTQLALRLLQQADGRGERAAYICFNRALADHMARLAPVRVQAETFHEMSLRLARRAGHAVDFTTPGVFDTLVAAAIGSLQNAPPDLDLLVLDEGQDLQPDWVEALLLRLKDGGQLVLMEDPDQALYRDRQAFDLAEAVTVTSFENFRTPRALVDLINRLGLTRHPIEACAPVMGEPPEPRLYDDEAGALEATAEAVQRCIGLGFDAQDMAVVSFRGMERSAVLRRGSLAGLAFRRFTGTFDEGGVAQWTAGALLADTVRRFKGQAAPAVVFTECDFERLDEVTRRLLFVGLTRARLHVEWVVSRRAAGLLGL